MQNLLLAFMFDFRGESYDVTFIVIVAVLWFLAWSSQPSAKVSPTIQTGARIVKMTAVLLLLSFSGLSQTMKQVSDNKFIVENLSENFDTTKLIFVRTMMEINDSTMTNPTERFFAGRNYIKISFDYWGEYLIKFKQKRDDGDFKHVDFWVIYFANKTVITKTVGIQFAEPIAVRD